MSRREPFMFVESSRFDYKYFNGSFAIKKEMWFPDRPPEMMEGHDITKMMSERMTFVDSRLETLIQAVDILTSFLRRLLAREITGHNVSQALGRLRIHSRRKSEYPQLLRVLTLADQAWGRSDLFDILGVMTRAPGTMPKPKRARRRPARRRPKVPRVAYAADE